MPDRSPCPNCGHENSSYRVTCKRCHKNLEEATYNVLVKEASEGNKLPLQERDDDSRVLCRDGDCIGIIGPDGRCNICGLPITEDQDTREGIFENNTGEEGNYPNKTVSEVDSKTGIPNFRIVLLPWD